MDQRYSHLDNVSNVCIEKKNVKLIQNYSYIVSMDKKTLFHFIFKLQRYNLKKKKKRLRLIDENKN